MRKDGAAAAAAAAATTASATAASSPISFSSSCLDVKPFVATLVVVTLIMAVSQLQPYESLVATTRPSCPIPTQKLSSSALSSASQLNATALPIKPVIAALADPKPSRPLPDPKPSRPLPDPDPKPSRPLPDPKPSRPLPDPDPKPSRPLPDPNKREFKAYGSAAALFVQMGAYRGGPATFAVVGLASKPTHVFGKPWFKCEWVPNSPGRPPVRAKAYKMLPDWGYGRVYTVVVVNCTFPTNPNADNSGGRLFLYAYYSPSPRRYERFVALEEAAGAYDESRFSPPFPYDFLYCGSSLYGDLSAARIREWMAYHARLFGPRSHFVFHDAGGVGPAVRAALEPWVRAGRATVQDIRGQAEYDGYYYNQFLVVNDCLHRYRYAANWTFYFDVDEYIYVLGNRTLESVLAELSPYTQFTIEQNPMSSKLCVLDPHKNYSKEWGFEKLVFRNSITGVRRDRKYAIQAKNAYATGVHMSENVIGPTTHKTESMIRYYHYHNSINVLGEPCREFVPIPAKGHVTSFEKIPYVYDDSMKRIADTVKLFEEQTIGAFRV